MDQEINEARTVEQARAVLAKVGLPCLVESCFGLAEGERVYDDESFDAVCAAALSRSPTREIRISGLGGST